MKRQINKFDYLKTKQNGNQLFYVKNHNKPSQRHRVMWEKVLAMQSTQKSLIILIYKELVKIEGKTLKFL